jgi:hypothetical protein
MASMSSSLKMQLFDHFKVRGNGEWFRFTKHVQSEVSRFCEIAASKEAACLMETSIKERGMT